jgi:hypothetical protein
MIADPTTNEAEWATDDDGAAIRLRTFHRCAAMIWTGLVWMPRRFATTELPHWRAHYFAEEHGGEEITHCPACGCALRGLMLTEGELSRVRDEAFVRDLQNERRGLVGRGGLPADVVAGMYFDYVLGASIEDVGLIWSRTRQSVHSVFQSHKLPLRADSKARCVDVTEWNGRKFAPGKNGYLRATDGGREVLEHLVWASLNGPVPEGMNVAFRDGNRRNCAPENLFLEAKLETLARGRTRPGRRVNQFSPSEEGRAA